MRRQFVLPLACLFLALAVPSSAQSETTTAASVDSAAPVLSPDPALTVHVYNVSSYILLNCSLPRAPDSADTYVWRKNGTLVEEWPHMKDRIVEKGEFFKMRGLEDDIGNYSCSLGSDTLTWEVRGRPTAKLAPNTNVVEKQQLKLVCKLVGKPYPSVQWSKEVNKTYAEPVLAEEGRVSLGASEQGVAGAVLTLAQAARADAGTYWCAPAAPGAARASTVLRVKDMYAALWPFLGICAEVFVLCAIILVYEKRRTKPELDDSDTDNHDQKKS